MQNCHLCPETRQLGLAWRYVSSTGDRGSRNGRARCCDGAAAGHPDLAAWAGPRTSRHRRVDAGCGTDRSDRRRWNGCSRRWKRSRPSRWSRSPGRRPPSRSTTGPTRGRSDEASPTRSRWRAGSHPPKAPAASIWPGTSCSTCPTPWNSSAAARSAAGPSDSSPNRPPTSTGPPVRSSTPTSPPADPRRWAPKKRPRQRNGSPTKPIPKPRQPAPGKHEPTAGSRCDPHRTP